MGSFKGRASKPVLKRFDTGIQKFHYGVHLLFGVVIGIRVLWGALMSVQLRAQPDTVVLEYHKALCGSRRISSHFHPDFLRRDFGIDQFLELFGGAFYTESCNPVQRGKNLSCCHRSYKGVAVREGIVKGQRKSVPCEVHGKLVIVCKGELYISFLEVGKDWFLDVLWKGYNRASAASRQGTYLGVRRGSGCKELSVCINVEHQTGLVELLATLCALRRLLAAIRGSMPPLVGMLGVLAILETGLL